MIIRFLNWLILQHKQMACDKCGWQFGRMYLCAQHNPKHPGFYS
jgi:hypothetical protein